jgi:3-deoxy-D-manno-octulosonate 8-phosphate phosphatase (KDO 8-P phosphatase)
MGLDRRYAERLAGVRMLILDVDGVLTDGRIVYTDDGGETKSFNVRDGYGIKLLMRAGVEVALVTARESRSVARRATDLGITLLNQGAGDKLAAFDEILRSRGLKPRETACMGDDLMDLPLITRAGFSATVPEAPTELRERVDYITRAGGGNGAVREVIEMILKACGKWDGVIKEYLR